MEFFNQQNPQLFQDLEDEHCSLSDSDPEYDSDMDPSYNILDKTRSKNSTISIKEKSKSSIGKDFEMGDVIVIDPEEEKMDVGEIDERSYEQVDEMIKAGKVDKLKVVQCKVYLRKNGLRLTGNKDTLIQRIKEHREILNGRGEEKYPVSSFELNCKGDVCMGDIVMFEQNVYEMYSIVSRSASGPPCGTRIVAGRIVKESYGSVKQQHTFTIEVLWSKGEKSLPPLYPLLIKGRNLYRLKTLRQRWENEDERRKVLTEKHLRGSQARSARETRIQEKEKKKVMRENRTLTKVDRNRNLSLLNSILKENQGIQARQSGSCANFGTAAGRPQQSSLYVDIGKLTIQPRESGSYIDVVKLTTEALKTRVHTDAVQMGDGALRLAVQPQHSGSSILAVKVGNGHHRQPLTSMDHNNHPMSLPNRQGFQRRQLCKFYAEGRCWYGDKCKFFHNPEEICGQSRGRP